MLVNLHIKNFAIVDELMIDFHAGMSAITGETGAGKSIMIDALALCLGNRADSKTVRPNTERCDIAAIFDIQKNKAAINWLKENELNQEDECIIRRTISQDGRSRAYINGQVTPLQQLRQLGLLLVNIHGQHEHQALLKPENQRERLDAYAQHEKLLQELQSIYTTWQQTQSELEKLLKQQNNQSHIDLLRYQVEELNELKLQENELDELDADQKKLANADQIIVDCQRLVNLVEADNEHSLLESIGKAQSISDGLKKTDNRFASINELLNNASIYLHEASEECHSVLNETDIDPQQLQAIEKRLAAIYDIARKHHVKPPALFEIHQQLSKELAQLQNSEQHIASLQLDIRAIQSDYAKIAKKLTDSRQKAAKKLNKLVSESVRKLGMPNAQFEIQFEAFTDGELHPYGAEKIMFMVTINPGQPLQAMHKVASGGELSRISLAIQVITTNNKGTPTLLFDEVDSGIGGSVAQIVGQLLRQLGDSTQLMCVTHLPQVASQANHHAQVTKTMDVSSTRTDIVWLNEQERVDEIARMLGGTKMTKQTLAHAKEMLLEV